MRNAIAALIGAAALAAACGGDDSQGRTEATSEATPTTEAEGEVSLSVRVVAEQVGFGCSSSMRRSGLDVGNGSRMAVEDGDGATLGVGTFALTKGAESCDWTAAVDDVPDGRDFYTLIAGEELATVSNDELSGARFKVWISIDATGAVDVAF